MKRASGTWATTEAEGARTISYFEVNRSFTWRRATTFIWIVLCALIGLLLGCERAVEPLHHRKGDFILGSAPDSFLDVLYLDDASSWPVYRTNKPLTERIRGAVFDPQKGCYYIALVRPSRIVRFDPKNEKEVKIYGDRTGSPLKALQISEDRAFLYFVDGKGVRRLNLDTGDSEGVLPHGEDEVLRIDMPKTGRSMGVGRKSGVYLFDLATNETTLVRFGAYLKGVSPDGRRVLCGDNGRLIIHRLTASGTSGSFEVPGFAAEDEFLFFLSPTELVYNKTVPDFFTARPTPVAMYVYDLTTGSRTKVRDDPMDYVWFLGHEPNKKLLGKWELSEGSE